MDPILVGKAVTTETSGNVFLLPKYGNRHGLVAGATGTGKTVTLMTLAEGFSRIGVPVFMADVKGDVAGLAVAGDGNEKVLQRAAELGVEGYAPGASPATSPFTSAMNTGTPIREKPSARVIRVTVLPVPVAPATRPWRLPNLGSNVTAISSVMPLPSRMGSI